MEERGGVARSDDVPFFEDDEGVADGLHVVEQVAGNQDGHTLLVSEAADHHSEVLHPGGV